MEHLNDILEIEDDESNELLLYPVMHILEVFKYIFEVGHSQSVFNKKVLREVMLKIEHKDVSLSSQELLPYISMKFEDFVKKQNVYKRMKMFNIGSKVFDKCAALYFAMTSYILNNYQNDYDGYRLLQTAPKMSSCLISYKKSNVCDLDFIEAQLKEFIISLIRRILNVGDCLHEKEMRFINLVMQIMLSFKKIYAIHKVVLSEVTEVYRSWIRYKKLVKVEVLNPYEIEIAAVFLNILKEFIEVMSITNNVLLKSERFSNNYQKDLKDIDEVLEDVSKFVPNYLQREIRDIKLLISLPRQCSFLSFQ